MYETVMIQGCIQARVAFDALPSNMDDRSRHQELTLLLRLGLGRQERTAPLSPTPAPGNLGGE